jgi:hypothetical protein
MLLPITSRLLDVVFKPERPCWKLMGCCSWGRRGVSRRAFGSEEGPDRVVGHAVAIDQLERERVAEAADGLDALVRPGSSPRPNRALVLTLKVRSLLR